MIEVMFREEKRQFTATHHYEPFGVELEPFGNDTTDNKYRFTGQERDYSTNFDYMHFRFYASSMGRFLKPDNLIGTIANPQSWNLYSYVNENPANFNDPSGLLGPMTDWNTMLPKEPPPATNQEQDLADPLGSQEGQEALEYYTDVITDPDSATGEIVVAAVGAFFSSLWTPDTACSTAAVIVTAGTGEVLAAASATPEAAAAAPEASAAMPESGAAIDSAAQAANLERFKSGLPKAAGEVKIFNLPKGGKAFQADVPAKNIPGSYAIYEKQVNAAGKTLNYTETTIAPDGSVVNVKIKYPPPVSTITR